MTKGDGRSESKTCHSCGYCCPRDMSKGEDGTCRRHAPVVQAYTQNYEVDRDSIGAVSVPASPFVTLFPRVRADDWCGEWGFYSLDKAAGGFDT